MTEIERRTPQIDRRTPQISFEVTNEDIRAEINTNDGIKINIQLDWDTLKTLFTNITGDSNDTKYRTRK